MIRHSQKRCLSITTLREGSASTPSWYESRSISKQPNASTAVVRSTIILKMLQWPSIQLMGKQINSSNYSHFDQDSRLRPIWFFLKPSLCYIAIHTALCVQVIWTTRRIILLSPFCTSKRATISEQLMNISQRGKRSGKMILPILRDNRPSVFVTIGHLNKKISHQSFSSP